MFPVLFRIGGFTVTSFGLMMLLSFLVGGWLLSRELARRELRPDIAWDALVWLALGGIVGAKVYYLALHWSALAADPVGELTSRGGLVWFGGLAGGALAYVWYARRRALPLATMLDASALPLTLAYAVGRVGCFLVGDDYGLPTRSWLGVAFPNGSPPSTAGYLRSVGAHVPGSVPDTTVLAVHPTQLYEIAAALVIFGILWRVARRPLRPGRLFGAWLALYSVERFLIEFVRAKDDRIAWGFTTSQVVAALTFALGTYLWTRRRSRPQERRAALADAA